MFDELVQLIKAGKSVSGKRFPASKYDYERAYLLAHELEKPLCRCGKPNSKRGLPQRQRVSSRGSERQKRSRESFTRR